MELRPRVWDAGGRGCKECPVLKYCLRRFLGLVPLLGIVVLAVFALIRWVPGGPFDAERVPASPEIERALRERYHLDEPVVSQAFRFLRGCLMGDLGPSLKYRNHSVVDILRSGIPVSLVLGGLSFLVAVGLGIPLGFLAAAGGEARGVTAIRGPGTAGVGRGGGNAWLFWGGRLAGTLAWVAVCIPGFVAGPLLVMLFGVRLGWFPVALWGGPIHWVLPVATLGLYFAGRVARLVEEGMRQTLRMEFVRTARAKGLSEWSVWVRHVFPLASVPLVSYAGPLLADLLTGSFVVENLFQLPGIGTMTVNSALNRDYPLIVGLALWYSGLLLILNLLTDWLHAWVDPRVRLE